MVKLIGWRVVRLVATLLVVSFLTFSLTLFLPGDPINAILPPTAPRTPEIEAEIREEFRLDDPFVVRYGDWLSKAVRGDLGKSYLTSQPVLTTIKEKLPITAELAVLAVLLAVVLAVPIGVLGAYRQGSVADQVTSGGVQLALSFAPFIVGIFLIWIFAIKVGILPATGWARIGDKGLIENLKGAILPALALALGQMAFFSRIVRSDMIATLQENYILSARAKGLRDWYILFRHALRPSSLSLVTIVGLNLGALLGGTVAIEQIFAIGGLGRRLLEAIFQRDILVIQGIVVFITTVYVLINTFVDVVYLFLDPRIRRR
jgi:peptide/nickel transport system permease protein